MCTQISSFLPILTSLISIASAHGRITNITTSSGTVYHGFDPSFPEPSLVAWSASNLGNIYVTPSDFNTSSISCHYHATPGTLSIPTTPSSILKLQWNEWPSSHKGPILTYLAACNSTCATADSATLKWSKIDELGWMNSSDPDGLKLGGTWASDVLRRNGASWMIRVPDELEEGEYVLRHEIIALHVAEQMNGAQAYPQCVNLKVAGRANGKGKSLDGGVLGRELYAKDDKGILVNVHGSIIEYQIPGPKVWDGAEIVRQPGEVL